MTTLSFEDGRKSRGTLLEAVALDKSYQTGKDGANTVPVLRGIDLTLRRGEFVAILGQSGSGKSTLLHLLGLLDRPELGEVRLEGDRIDHLPDRQRDRLRNRTFGFVFQSYHLLPELTLLENVLTPLMIRDSALAYWRRRGDYREQAAALLERVGLGHRLTHRPSELSGGEMQRGAIARALITRPEVLLADEPTGNLDAQSSGEIMDLIRSLHTEDGLTIAMVTHDEALAATADRTVRLTEGRCHTLKKCA